MSSHRRVEPTNFGSNGAGVSSDRCNRCSIAVAGTLAVVGRAAVAACRDSDDPNRIAVGRILLNCVLQNFPLALTSLVRWQKYFYIMSFDRSSARALLVFRH